MRSLLVVSLLAGGAVAADAPEKPNAATTVKAPKAKAHHKAKAKKARKSKQRHKSHAKLAK